MILYTGLGIVAVGLVIMFVGLGDKGFRTLEMKLLGPSLVGGGLFLALLRILFCVAPSSFESRSSTQRLREEDGTQNRLKTVSHSTTKDGATGIRPVFGNPKLSNQPATRDPIVIQVKLKQSDC